MLGLKKAPYYAKRNAGIMCVPLTLTMICDSTIVIFLIYKLATSFNLVFNLQFSLIGYSRKHPYQPHRGNRPPLDVLINFLILKQSFSPSPPAETTSVGGVQIFSGTTKANYNARTKATHSNVSVFERTLHISRSLPVF
jgi:hypothetical protein